MMIDFGVQFSCPDGSDQMVINPSHNDLLEIFYDDETMCGYFNNISFYQIIFRVSGCGTDFEGDGPEFIKINRKRKKISIDFTIPESRWRDVPQDKFRSYLSKGVRECFDLLREKAVETGELLNSSKLDEDFFQGIASFDSK